MLECCNGAVAVAVKWIQSVLRANVEAVMEAPRSNGPYDGRVTIADDD